MSLENESLKRRIAALPLKRDRIVPDVFGLMQYGNSIWTLISKCKLNSLLDVILPNTNLEQ